MIMLHSARPGDAATLADCLDRLHDRGVTAAVRAQLAVGLMPLACHEWRAPAPGGASPTRPTTIE